MTALAEAAECELKKLVTQQGHSLLARVLYTGKHPDPQLPRLNTVEYSSPSAGMLLKAENQILDDLQKHSELEPYPM